MAQNLIVDPAIVPQAQRGFALDTQCLAQKLYVAVVIRNALANADSPQACQALPLMPRQVFVQRCELFRVPFLCIFQIGHRSFYFVS